jgi:orotate phosphoribosyltransferase
MITKENQTTLFTAHSPRKEVECPPAEVLLSWSRQALDKLPTQRLSHVEGCPKCAFDFTVWRAANCLSQLPAYWLVHFGDALREWQTSDVYETRQMLGQISIETNTFSLCDEQDWTPSPLAMRTNLVIDEELRLFSLTVLDVPNAIESIALMTSHGMRHFQRIDEDVFELLISEESAEEHEFLPLLFADVWSQMAAHKIQLAIGMTDACGIVAGTGDAVEILEQYEAIERKADYLLPCGMHCDTYVNVAALCAHEDAMQLIAAKIDFLFWDTHFDAVLANGWAMSLIARRLADARQAQGRKEPIRLLQCEGYDDPTLLNDVVPGSQVLLLFDVVITGNLANKIIRMVKANGGDVVGVAVLVKPHASPAKIEKLRSLCELEMELSINRLNDSTRATPLPKLVFNPIAGYMTTKSGEPRSPSDFLNQDGNARELWEYVSRANAYEHHRREGDTHYIAFVDTQKLLENREIATALVAKLAEAIRNSGPLPDVLLVPKRARARLLAVRLARALGAFRGARPKIVYAAKSGSAATWRVSADHAAILRDKSVCIVDTAAGHGRTVDQFAALATRRHASSISAAVLLSRLSPPCEAAFARRLSGGFHRLYSLPIRPVAIRGDRLDLCPVCRRKNAIRQFAEESDMAGLEQWATRLLSARRGPAERHVRKRDRQLSLFDRETPFLSSCGAAVASGVTLHALGAASTNGSAPLVLPELSDDRIPWRVRATMVENLPPGILEWTGNTLESDLVGVLAGDLYPSVWKATANLLAREGSDVWLDHLGTLLHRLEDTNHRTSPSFWNHMACNAYLLAAAQGQVREDFHVRIDELLLGEFDGVVEHGLRQMKEVVRD